MDAGAGSYVRDPHSFHGRVEMRPLTSKVLRGNALGDPYVRELPVYLPPGWDAPGARHPVVVLLAGLTSRPHKYLETHPWRPGVVPLFDRAVAAGDAPPAILVLPDGFTALGGSQYVNSSAVGRYEDYLVDEVLPFVDRTYPTRPDRRAVVGKSSGGFGALHLSMRHPGLFRAAASISGDCCFEHCYGPDLLACLRGLVPHGGDPARFLMSFREKPELRGDDHAVLNVLAMSACFSPNPESPLGFDLPMDLQTGERRPEVWERWLAFDPLHACELHADALRGLSLLHLECGRRDEFHLQWGLRALLRRLDRLGIPYEHEEHDGGHFGIDDRFLAVLPRLVRAVGSA